MNFSRKGTRDKQNQIRSTSKKLAVKAGVSFFRVFLVCLVLAAVTGVFAGIGILKGVIDNAPEIEPDDIIPKGYFTTIYDSKGNEIQRLVASDANREYASIDEIPEVVQNAFIAIEDERFWDHNGIDVKGIFRAFFSGLSKGDFDQGASTITQQLLKNQIFEGGMEASFAEKLERKIQEQYLAVKLSDEIPKEKILEYYLNTINLGQNTLGVKAAAARYFNKDIGEITLSEAAVIAGITKSPAYLNPIKSPSKNAERRLEILNKMKEQGYIDDAQYNEAVADDVYARIELVNEEQYAKGTTVNSYFVDELIDQVTTDLQELGYSSTQAYNMIYRAGLKIYTTQVTSIQKTCDEILKDESLYPADSEYELTYRLTTVDKNGEKRNYNEGMLKEYFLKKNPSFTLYFKKKKAAEPYIEEYRNSVLEEGDTIEGEVISYTIQPQVSFVLMEQSTGHVVALVGGRGPKTASRTLNRATDSARQPGSTFKILSTYLPALDTKGMTLATVKDDAPYSYPGTEEAVNNWDKKQYNGLTSIRQAIYNSMNIIAVKTLEDVTLQTGFSYLQKLGFTTLEENYVDERTGKSYSDINYSLALGGITKGVTNMELTAAFAAVANGGIYTKPVLYTKIVDHNGKVLIDNTPQTTQVMKDSTAWLLTSAMEDVVNIGTGKRLKLQNVDMPVAGKTGTTTNDIDLWFVGYTPYYTAGIWGGYDNNRKQENTTYTRELWRTIMEKLHKKKKKKDFVKPDSIVTAAVCGKCGKLAVDGVCDRAKGGSVMKQEYFAKGSVPTETCDCHVKVKVCISSGRTPGPYCPANTIGYQVYLTKDETAATADTPNILPKNFDNRVCNIHGYVPPETEPEEEPGEEEPSETEGGEAPDAETPDNGDSGEGPSEPTVDMVPPVSEEPGGAPPEEGTPADPAIP